MSESSNSSTAGKDSRDGGQGPTDIPEETVASESELSMSQHIANRDGEQEEGK